MMRLGKWECFCQFARYPRTVVLGVAALWHDSKYSTKWRGGTASVGLGVGSLLFTFRSERTTNV